MEKRGRGRVMEVRNEQVEGKEKGYGRGVQLVEGSVLKGKVKKVGENGEEEEEGRRKKGTETKKAREGRRWSNRYY